MVSDAIRLVLTNLPSLLFFAALLIATLRGGSAQAYLDWLLLLSIGVTSVWAGLYHVFAPETAAAFIGWQVSPFQFEVGIADIALGVIGIVAFWQTLAFKAAVILFTTVYYVGLVIGHIHQIVSAGNWTAGNAGALLLLTVLQPILLIACYWILARRQAAKPL
ncbi:hypothetical protein OSH10_16060 [Kaistia defluvii]|uniref:DUF6790 family protein n=1 Tax=Kaistia defluvii TaxID=410841 RepID=UPI0022532C6B|nr:DUF6790 family protein [Kaistia defluvii]MCX5519957.1 hypothetical protein [Kaistia defluvii]